MEIKHYNYLKEDINAVKKYYPNIPEDVFMQLITLDPTYRNNNSLGKYGKWILNLYNKGNLSEDDFAEVTPLLQQFTIYRNRIQDKDLNRYKTLEELADILASVVDDDSMLTDRQKLRFQKNVKAGRIKIAAEDDYDTVFDDYSFTVYVPNTHEASMKLGKGTEWCTAHENPMWYEKYTDGGYKLYIIKNKETGERYQYSDLDGDILDQEDEEFDYMETFYGDKDLVEFLNKIDSDTFPALPPITDDGYIETDSVEDLPKVFKQQIRKVKIVTDFNYIEDNAFNGCTNLEEVIIPNNIEVIGPGAFENCESLAHISLPKDLKSIDDSAFHGCESITNLILPKSLTSIPKFCFGGCLSLNKIVLPENIKEINEYAFCICMNLSEVVLPKGIKSIKYHAFSTCKSLKTIIIPDGVVSFGKEVFGGNDDIIVYTNSPIVTQVLKKEGIDVRPNTKTESVGVSMKLRIKEDTACVPSKTSYMNSGKDKNGIYYFGKKRMSINWKDYKKASEVRKKGVVEMVLREDFGTVDGNKYVAFDTKTVRDFDGFDTDYTMYGVIPASMADEYRDWLVYQRTGNENSVPSRFIKYFVFVLGDIDYYNPNDDEVEFDYECESKGEAYEWFDEYIGYGELDTDFDDDDDYFDESLKKSLSESLEDEHGVFTMLDDEVGNFEGNMPEDDIDKALVYLQKVSKLLKAGFSDITYYGCEEDYLSPLEKPEEFKLKQIYKNGKYDAYVGEFDGKPFVIDHFDTRRAFGIYAKDEDTIKDIIEYMENSY